ncbi:flavodoxin family protein [Agromyces laixinhei]|uniref:flavodoxin family protein n=1 Tax=Agromyces laixinhei TaxID=2585717 RepID=UPI0012ED2EC3|nr:NAD(P)H-dependent oxidoreductase [Agromyces laixinhei]
MEIQPLRAVALVCTLKSSGTESSSEKLAGEVLLELARHEVVGQALRVADYDVRPGVTTDEGDGDEWPKLRQHVVDSDIVILATPTWLGHPSSLAQRVLERLDAELSEVDDDGRPSMFGKVALVAVVGNEDGAHSIVADVQQALNDIGFTLPAQGCSYWNGEAMGSTDYLELSETPASTAAATATAAVNAVHLARLLADSPYSAPEQ